MRVPCPHPGPWHRATGWRGDVIPTKCREYPCLALARLPSGPDTQRADQPAQGRDDAERRQHAGARVARRRHALDEHLEPGRLGIDDDAVRVKLPRRVGPDLDGWAVRAAAGEAKDTESVV